MRRTAFVLVALAMGLASSARAFPAYDRELTERPPWRILLDGGVSIPLNLSLSGGGYQVGGGLGLGFEFPQSDSYSFIVRAEYDHASQDRFSYASGDPGSADFGTLRAGVRFQRSRETWIRGYTEAGFGGVIQRLSNRVTTDYTTGASHLEVTRGGGALFAVGGGITARTEGRLAFFLETYLVYLFPSQGSSQIASIRLGISMP